MNSPESDALAELQRIPSIGPRVGQMLIALGIRRIADLRGKSPERLYDELIVQRGEHVDRCVLYTFRCAVYFATESAPDPARLQWWKWKDAKSAK